MKYRIVRNGLGEYAVQYHYVDEVRGEDYWLLEGPSQHDPYIFKSREDANFYIIKQYASWDLKYKWEVVG